MKFSFIILEKKSLYIAWASFRREVTAAGVVPCGGPKKSPSTSSIVQIIFSYWSFEIREDILRNQKIIIGLDSYSNQRSIYVAPFRLY